MSAVESWFAPAAVAEPLPRPRSPRRASAASPATLPAPRSPRRAPAASPAKRAAPRRATASARSKAQQRQSFRVRLSVVWMVALALLLVGVVAVNVAVLRANVSVSDLDKRISQLQQGNASLASQYSSARAVPQVHDAARQAGLVQAPTPTPIDMGSGK